MLGFGPHLQCHVVVQHGTAIEQYQEPRVNPAVKHRTDRHQQRILHPPFWQGPIRGKYRHHQPQKLNLNEFEPESELELESDLNQD